MSVREPAHAPVSAGPPAATSGSATAVAPRPAIARLAAVRDRLMPAYPYLRVIGFVGAIAIVVFMGVKAARHVHFSDLVWWPLPLAIAAAATWWLLLARGWAVLVRGHSTRNDIATWCRTQALRYLPGGFWAPASRVAVIQGGMLDRVTTVAAENVLALCSALAIGGIGLALSGRWLWLPLGLAVVAPVIASRFLASRTRIAPARTALATVNYVVAFASYAATAVLVQSAVSGPHHLFAVIGAGAIAWAAGLVVVIAPSGVGVREVTYVALLSGVFPSAELAAAAVTTRLVMIIAELAVLVVAGRPTPEPR